MMKRLLFIILAAGYEVDVEAQKMVNSQTTGWYSYSGTHTLSDKWSVFTMYEWRRSGLVKNWQQSFLFTGMNYKANNHTVVSGGYNWLVIYPYGAQPIAHTFNEHRIWEQLVLQQNAGSIRITHRYRLEQRFLEQFSHTGSDFVKNGFKYLNRIRYMLGINIPVKINSEAENKWFIILPTRYFSGLAKELELMFWIRIVCNLA